MNIIKIETSNMWTLAVSTVELAGKMSACRQGFQIIKMKNDPLVTQAELIDLAFTSSQQLFVENSN